MRAVLVILLAGVIATPAAAAVPAAYHVLDRASGTTLQPVDTYTLASKGDPLTVPGDVEIVEPAPPVADGFVALGPVTDPDAPGFPYKSQNTDVVFSSGVTTQLAGGPLTALWLQTNRVLVLTDFGGNSPATVSAIDPATGEVMSQTALDGAPGAAARIGSHLAVVETGHEDHPRPGPPDVKLFDSGGALVRTVSLAAIAPAGGASNISLFADGGLRLLAFASDTGRYAEIIVDGYDDSVKVRRTPLKAPGRQVGIVAASLRFLTLVKRGGVYRITRATGAVKRLGRFEQVVGSGNHWVAKRDTTSAVQFFNGRGRQVWSALDGVRLSGPLTLGWNQVYAQDTNGTSYGLGLYGGGPTGTTEGKPVYRAVFGGADGGYWMPYDLYRDD